MPDRIHLTVATVIERDGLFLMVKETDKTTHQQVYNQPAGHVHPGEKLTAAALRETLEETGWQVELTGVIGISTYRAPGNGVTYYRVTFIAKPIQRVCQQIDSDIDEVVWLDQQELKQLKTQFRSPLVSQAIEDYLNGCCYPMKLICEHH